LSLRASSRPLSASSAYQTAEKHDFQRVGSAPTELCGQFSIRHHRTDVDLCWRFQTPDCANSPHCRRSAKETPCFVEIVDIAGLVRGASEGRGLGNAFLANIGAVQSILHVVRAFDDSSIEHVEGAVDPVRDLALIKEELALRDLSLLDHRAKARRAPPAEVEMARALIPVLEAGKDVHAFVDALLPEKRAVVNTFGLLSTKKSQVLLNVDEAGLRGNRHTEAFLRHSPATLICGKLEAEVADLDDAEAKAEMLASYGITSTAIEIVAQNTIDLLDAAVFYTTGDTESRAWLFKRGTIARECAGLIHTSFVKNFVRAEVRSFADALANKTARIEGPQVCACRTMTSYFFEFHNDTRRVRFHLLVLR
jgi:ribosome-binding ATPase YchF (GTP1/OBG family)